MPTRIEWCDETINPLGHWCLGVNGTVDNPKPCEYCYAKIYAKRHLASCVKCQSFSIPHTHFEQLDKLNKWMKCKNIFVQSMGDLFHDAVHDSWIEQVFAACVAAPQHRYLFLTKNPNRYLKLFNSKLLPNSQNFWFGTSITKTSDPYIYHEGLLPQFFVSIEPLMESFDIPGIIEMPPWLIVGSETGNRKNRIIPKREWIENIVNQARENKVPVFLKNNLAAIWGETLIQEKPWE